MSLFRIHTVYVGRAQIVYIDGVRYPENDSLWCNPFKVDKTDDLSREDNIAKFEEYIRKRITDDNVLIDELRKLKGKTLG